MNGRLAQFARYLSMRQLECFDPGMQWWGYKRSLRSTSTWPNPWTQQCHRTNQTFWKLRGKINRVLPSSTNFQQTQILAWLSIKIYIFFCLANLWFLNCCWKLAGRKKGDNFVQMRKRKRMTCTCSRWCRARRQGGQGRRGQGGSQIQQRSQSPVQINLHYLFPARLHDHFCKRGTWARCHMTEALLCPSLPWQSPES